MALTAAIFVWQTTTEVTGDGGRILDRAGLVAAGRVEQAKVELVNWRVVCALRVGVTEWLHGTTLGREECRGSRERRGISDRRNMISRTGSLTV